MDQTTTTKTDKRYTERISLRESDNDKRDPHLLGFRPFPHCLDGFSGTVPKVEPFGL